MKDHYFITMQQFIREKSCLIVLNVILSLHKDNQWFYICPAFMMKKTLTIGEDSCGILSVTVHINLTRCFVSAPLSMKLDFADLPHHLTSLILNN